MSSANNGESSNNNNARALIVGDEENLHDVEVLSAYDQYRFNPGAAGPSRNPKNPRKRTRKHWQAASAGPSSSNANNPRVAGINANAQNPRVAGTNVHARNLGVAGVNANAQNPGEAGIDWNGQYPEAAGIMTIDWWDWYRGPSNEVTIPRRTPTTHVIFPNWVEALKISMSNMSVNSSQHRNEAPESSSRAMVIYQGSYEPDLEANSAMVVYQLDSHAEDETIEVGDIYVSRESLPYNERTMGWYITYRTVIRKGVPKNDPFYHHCRSNNQFRAWPEVISYINDNSLPVRYPPGEAPARRQKARNMVDLFFVGYCRIIHEPQRTRFRFRRNRNSKRVSTRPVRRQEESGSLMEPYEHHLYDIVPHAPPTAE